MNWIRQTTRLAIYMRDGRKCIWCRQTNSEVKRLTLDHVKTYSGGGSNDPSNLVTSCMACNASRGAKSAKVFARYIAERTDQKPREVTRRVRNAKTRVLPRPEARALIRMNGSAKKALAAMA